ncbi:MAG: N-acetyltransferase [Phenylobacterium sp.]|jgi:ribosomal-protein-alanine N-acetyltransferase|uniref:GNAT family N-acetyltransferase n=2 Tax=Phenylobacterium sp. TaxID=1871053 RepID=UPI002A36158F|nr:N-acetyltransferase [Phenylobacterium sp.]MDX9997973.1 N-acetyltransferase [Phenylobacterium sp.]
MMLRPAGAGDCEVLSALHATAFDEAWPPGLIGDLLASPGAGALLIEDEAPQAMILWRAAGGEGEILTLAVDPRRRRKGIARLLVEAASGLAKTAGAEALFLEVAHDNDAAIALYRGAGFEEVGRRPGYYGRGGGQRADALVMRRDLNTAPPNPYPRVSERGGPA